MQVVLDALMTAAAGLFLLDKMKGKTGSKDVEDELGTPYYVSQPKNPFYIGYVSLTGWLTGWLTG